MKFFLPGPLSFFVKESSALQWRGTGSPALCRSIKHYEVNGKWPAHGASARVSDYSDAARGSGCPSAPPSRLASPAQHTRPHLHPPRGPTQSAPARRWQGAARAGPTPGQAALEIQECAAAVWGDELNTSAAFALCSGVNNLTGCAPRFLFVTGCSWKAFKIKLGLKYQSAKQLLQEKDH